MEGKHIGQDDWRRRQPSEREGEQGGGCGFPSWLLLIFCRPQSASAISIHFLHLSIPSSSLTPSSHILLQHQLSITILPPIRFPICRPVSLHHMFPAPLSHRIHISLLSTIAPWSSSPSLSRTLLNCPSCWNKNKNRYSDMMTDNKEGRTHWNIVDCHRTCPNLHTIERQVKPVRSVRRAYTQTQHTSRITPPSQHMAQHTSHPRAKRSWGDKLAYGLKIGWQVASTQPLPAWPCFTEVSPSVCARI